MESSSEILMHSGVVALCPDCGDAGLFVPVDDGSSVDGCEFCCTRCDTAVFLLEVVDNTGSPHTRVA